MPNGIILEPKIPVARISFKIKEVEKIDGCDSTVGGANKFACADPKYNISYPYDEDVILIRSDLSEEGKTKTIRHEKTEAILMATIKELDYDSAHLLTNRIDQIYGNVFRKDGGD